MAIKQSVLSDIKKNTQLKSKIALATNRSIYTVELWVKNNDESLTLASALRVIREELGIGDDQILEEVSESTQQN